MDKEQAKQELKGMLGAYLEQKGINPRKPFICLNPDHSEKHPSMSVKDTNCHCFSCGATYDIIDLLALDNGLDRSRDFYKILEIGCNMFSIDYSPKRDGQKQANYGQSKGQTAPAPATASLKNYEDYFSLCRKHLGDSKYLEGRGINSDTARLFGLGYDMHCKLFGGKPALIIPTGAYSYVARNTEQGAEKTNRYRKQGQAQLFNLKALESNRPVFVVEGELDAISIEQAGYKAIGLGSTSNTSALLKHLSTARPNTFFLLACDKDEQGQKAQHELKEGLIQLQLKCYDVDIAGGYKDANEHLTGDRDAFVEALESAERIEDAIREAEKDAYYKSFAGNRIVNFAEHIQTKGAYNPIKTGFPSFDKVIGGGLFAGLYVVGAISSLGKTTFCLQIADQIAKATGDNIERYEQASASGQALTPPRVTDVLVFSLEMAEDEIMAKSISRGTFNNCAGKTELAKTTRGILTGKLWDSYTEQELNLIYEAMACYKKDAQHIKIIEGMGDVGVQQIREITERHISITGNIPVVIVDYLQILAPMVDRGTDKQNTDKAVLELKKLSRDFNVPVIAISSFNRENYTEPVNMSSYKESGAVEYSSDVLIGIQYNGMDYAEGETSKDKKRTARIKALIDDNIDRGRDGLAQQLQLKVLKNRNGTKGSVLFEFFPKFNCFREIATPKTWADMGKTVSDWSNAKKIQ